jgi:hypothetical protein
MFLVEQLYPYLVENRCTHSQKEEKASQQEIISSFASLV